jgi:hypothetical protein
MPLGVTVYTESVEVRPLPQTSDQNKSKVVSGEDSQESISDANDITVYQQPTSPDKVRKFSETAFCIVLTDAHFSIPAVIQIGFT